MLFKEHKVHLYLEEYNPIWTCSNCSPVKCGKSDIVSFTSEVQIYNVLGTACPITSSNTTYLAQSFTDSFDINIKN
jgi:hypothetical protein